MPNPVPSSPNSMEIMQPFNIPTSVNAPIRTGPRMNLTFPVFTPPAASSYGSTMPITVPWHPPDLAGAINSGIQTGSRLATDFLQNRKTAQEIQAEEAVAKPAIAALHDPNMRQYAGYSVGPGGFSATVMSPAEAAIKQAEMAKTGAETEEARARTAGAYGQTEEAKAKIAEQQAATEKSRVETGLLGMNEAQRRYNAAKSGMVTTNTNQPQTDQTQDQEPSTQVDLQ